AGTLTAEEAQAIEDEIQQRLDEGYEKMREHEAKGDRTVFSGSTAVAQPAYQHAPVPTGVAHEMINHVGRVLTTVQDGFHLQPTWARRFVPRRIEGLEKGSPIDWAFADARAFGTLLVEGNPVRLSGQDCRRGTFSQRHAVFY